MKTIFNFQFSIFKNQKGFTLIELLIVVAIIGILASLLTANFIGVRQRSRDAQRKSNLRQIQSALELYRSDVGSYPAVIPNCGNALTKSADDCNTSVYMQKVPVDPSTSPYTYSTANNGNTYTITACLENENDPEAEKVDPLPPCDDTTGLSYTLENP